MVGWGATLGEVGGWVGWYLWTVRPGSGRCCWRRSRPILSLASWLPWGGAEPVGGGPAAPGRCPRPFRATLSTPPPPQVIKHFSAKEFLRPAILHELWDVAGKAYTAVAAQAPGADKAHKDLRAALALLSMAAASRPQAFGQQHVALLLRFGFSDRAPDALLARHACVMLERLGDGFSAG